MSLVLAGDTTVFTFSEPSTFSRAVNNSSTTQHSEALTTNTPQSNIMSPHASTSVARALRLKKKKDDLLRVVETNHRSNDLMEKSLEKIVE